MCPLSDDREIRMKLIMDMCPFIANHRVATYLAKELCESVNFCDEKLGFISHSEFHKEKPTKYLVSTANTQDSSIIYKGYRLYRYGSKIDRKYIKQCNAGAETTPPDVCLICMDTCVNPYRMCVGDLNDAVMERPHNHLSCKECDDQPKRKIHNCVSYACLNCWKNYIDNTPSESSVNCILCKRMVGKIYKNFIPFYIKTIYGVDEYRKFVCDTRLSLAIVNGYKF